MRVRELMETYLECLRGQGATWKKIQSQVKPLLQALGERQVEDLRGADLDAYRSRRCRQDSMRGAPVSQATVNRELTYLRAALRRAHQDELVTRLPPFRMRKETGARRDWWTSEQLDAVLQHFRRRHPCLADLFEFYALSGWRKGEALRLQWHEVDLPRGVINLNGSRTKEREARVLPIVGRLRAILERRRADRRDGVPWVFHRDGQERKDFRRAWDTARKACGCENLLHGLRRTMARRYLLAKYPVELIMKIGGWKSREMVERYARLETEDLAAAMLDVENPRKISP